MHDNTNFYYHPTVFSSPMEIRVMSEIFNHYITICAEAKVSEYLNLHTHTARRNVLKCKRYHCHREPTPFEFAVCLN